MGLNELIWIKTIWEIRITVAVSAQLKFSPFFLTRWLMAIRIRMITVYNTFEKKPKQTNQRLDLVITPSRQLASPISFSARRPALSGETAKHRNNNGG